MSTSTEAVPTMEDGRRDRRSSYRVPLTGLSGHARADWTSACRLTDISTGGVGFLARRSDAPLLDQARVLVQVTDAAPFRAVVQRIELGGPSEDWVRVGARFVDLAADERASLCALVTAHCG